MKRSLALLLTSLLLVFSLTACGKDQQSDGADGNGSVTDNNGAGGAMTGGGSDSANGGVNDLTNGGVNDPANGGVNDPVTGGVNGSGASTDGGSLADDAMDALDDVGDAARNAVRNGENAAGGTAGYTNSRIHGYTYDQMVQNGRVF